MSRDPNAGTAYLTERQREIHKYIVRYFARFGEGPTREEIRTAFHFRSPNAAQDAVEVLAKKGAVSWTPGKRRGIVPQSAPRPDAEDRYVMR